MIPKRSHSHLLQSVLADARLKRESARSSRRDPRGQSLSVLNQKERDVETGLDYFLARYCSSIQGRFTSTDPENTGANLGVPQSWNGYAETGGNPLTFTDPDGREYLVCGPNGNDGKCTTVNDEKFLKKN